MRFKLKVQDVPEVYSLHASEYQECKTYWQWAQYQPQLSEYLIKICNENQNKPWFTKALIAIGMRPGLPDYHYPIPNDNWAGLWIEMKTKKTKKHIKRANQDLWIEKLKRVNHYATYAYGSDDAISITKEYIENRI